MENEIILYQHIKHIYEECELDESATCRKFRQVQKEGKRHIERSIPFYNLDMIIALGYRIKSVIATKFRIWANDVIKTYLTRGYAINAKFERLENRVNNLEEKSKDFDLVVRTSLPPTEGIFFNGQVFDAYAFTSNLVKTAKNEIILIDNYIDETVLSLLDKRSNHVSALIYTSKITSQLQLDIEKHNSQYLPIEVKVYSQSHDRFLIIDNDIYHIGASTKDLGKKWFAFSLLHFDKKELMAHILL